MATEEKIDFAKLLTVQEVSAALGLTISTVQSMLSRGVLETIETRLGRFVHADTVAEYSSERLGKVGRPRKLLKTCKNS